MSNIKQDTQIIKDTIIKRIRYKAEYPYIFTTLQFGFYDNYGYLLPPTTIRKYWDKTEVEKTNRLVKNMLKEALGIDYFYFFMERHTPTYDRYGDVVNEGRYHIHLITSGINDSTVLQPNRRCKRLFYEHGSIGIPIKHMDFIDTDDKKIELFNACCKKANWINRYKYSIHTEFIDNPDELRRCSNYCLKEYRNDAKDFMDVVDFSNSDLSKTLEKELQPCPTKQHRAESYV